MPYESPEFSDLQIELLRCLAQGHTLTEALDHSAQLCGISKAVAKPIVEKASNDLGRFMGTKVLLAKARGRTGTFATADCKKLAPALEAIVSDREAAKAAVLRQHQLEALQLATCLDRNPLKIGAYQAHAERFLATAAQLMADHFPWIETRISIVQNRTRFKDSLGELRVRFDNSEFDVMLVPRDSEHGTTHLEYVYTYSFRVIGTRRKLEELRDADNVIDRLKLKAEPLIVGPKNSSSRQRIRKLLRDVDIDIETDSILIEDDNPSSMRMRAETGEGLAIMSDEYKAVGTSVRDFPRLGVGQAHGGQEVHKVEMGLLIHDGADLPRYRALRFIVRELVKHEEVCARAAVQD